MEVDGKGVCVKLKVSRPGCGKAIRWYVGDMVVCTWAVWWYVGGMVVCMWAVWWYVGDMVVCTWAVWGPKAKHLVRRSRRQQFAEDFSQ